MKLYEVPFRISLSGTALVVADDPAKARDEAAKKIDFDHTNLHTSNVFWDEGDSPILKDADQGGVRCILEIDNATETLARDRDFDKLVDRLELDDDQARLIERPKRGRGTSQSPGDRDSSNDQDQGIAGAAPIHRPAPQSGLTPPKDPATEVRSTQPTQGQGSGQQAQKPSTPQPPAKPATSGATQQANKPSGDGGAIGMSDSRTKK